MKQRIYLTSGGVLLLLSLFLFGNIESQKSRFLHTEQKPATFSVSDSLQKARQKLTASQALFVSKLENSISRGDVKQQSSKLYSQLADFWKDSVKNFLAYAYYLTEAAKLDNSEKRLTFAAQLFLDSLRREDNELVKNWEAETAAFLFEKALQLNPGNDNLRIGLGSSYVYGKGMSTGNPEEAMKGVQQLLQVVSRDSTNMQAQMVLGIGGVISRQYDKAITRLNKVVAAQPQNLEAVSWLADAYAESGDKRNAIKMYVYSKKLVNNPEYSREVDERIKALK